MFDMKKLFFLLFLAPAIAFASVGNPNLDAIVAALNSGDADGIAKYFGENVEISILDKEQIYTKANATTVLRTFFSSNKPKSFSLVHQGNSRGSTDQYCIGNLAANAGSYRVYLYLKMNGDKITIQELRLDKE